MDLGCHACGPSRLENESRLTGCVVAVVAPHVSEFGEPLSSDQRDHLIYDTAQVGVTIHVRRETVRPEESRQYIDGGRLGQRSVRPQ